MTHDEFIQKMKEIEDKYGIKVWHEVMYNKYVYNEFQKWLPEIMRMKLSEYINYKNPTRINKKWIVSLDIYDNKDIINGFDREITDLFNEYYPKNLK